MKTVLTVICVVLLGAAGARAAERIFVSGGPALLYFEKYKVSVHDKHWGNFIDVPVLRYAQIKNTIAPGDQVTWLVYRPAYVRRGKEDNANYIAAIRAKAAQINANLVWFDDTCGLIDYLNKGQDRGKVKIAHIEFFCHSNMLCFMFDYSNTLDGGGPATGMLHQNDLKKINRDVFAKKAYAKSWGCHSGESYSIVWQETFGFPMIGAIGKTDYSRGAIPHISTPDGKWYP